MEVKTTAKKSTYKKMSKAQRQEHNAMNSEKRRLREEANPQIAIRRKAKAKAYNAKKRRIHKNVQLEIKQAAKE